MDTNRRKLRAKRWCVALAVVGTVITFVGSRILDFRRTARVREIAASQGAIATTEFVGPEWLELELMRFPWLRNRLQSEIRSVRFQESPDADSAPIDLSYVLVAPGLRSLDLLGVLRSKIVIWDL